MATENEDKLSTKNETDIENVKTGLSSMTDEDIQRSKLDPNYEDKD